MTLRNVVWIILMFFLPFVAFAVEAEPNPLLSKLDQIGAAIGGFVGSLPENWAALGLVGMLVTTVAEAFFRLVKSDKPRSVLFAVAKFLDWIPSVLERVCGLLQALAIAARKLAVLLNGLIPQRLKEDPPKEEVPK